MFCRVVASQIAHSGTTNTSNTEEDAKPPEVPKAKVYQKSVFSPCSNMGRNPAIVVRVVMKMGRRRWKAAWAMASVGVACCRFKVVEIDRKSVV